MRNSGEKPSTEGKRKKLLPWSPTGAFVPLCLCALLCLVTHTGAKTPWFDYLQSVSAKFHHLTVEWQNLRVLSPQEQLKMADQVRIHPEAASILQRDFAPFPVVAEGEKKERQILQAILARPEFQYNQIKPEPVQWPSRWLNWFSRLLKKIASFMTRVLSRKKNWLNLSENRPGPLAWIKNPWIIYGLMSALAITMLVLLAKFGQSLTCNGEEGEALAQRSDVLNLPDSLRESPGYWSKQADLLISQGKTREAFRSLYLALLVGFHRLNYIDFHRGRTNWNYLTHFRGDVQARNLFQDLTQVFDLVWYGHQVLSALEYQRYKQAIRGVLNV